MSHVSGEYLDGKFRKSRIKGLKEAYLPALFASSHAANLLLLKNGDLLCFWFSGVWEGHGNVAILSARLPRNSNQWNKPVEIDHQPDRSFQNPVAFQADNGRISLIHTSQPAGEWQTNAQVVLLTSDDNGNSWQGPTPLFTKPGSFVRQPLLALNSVHWLLPMYYTPSRSITGGADANYSAIKVTNDGGQTWTECEVPESNGLVQPSIVRVANGRLIAFFRSRYADFVYQSTSADGCQWTTPVPTRIPNNNSSIQVVMLRNGALVLAFNNNSSSTRKERTQASPRKPLSVALSEDGGQTWPWVRDIETGDSSGEQDHIDKPKKHDEYSYPSVVQDRTGKIDVAYTFRHETIKIVKFDENWIKRGGTTGKFKGDPKP